MWRALRIGVTGIMLLLILPGCQSPEADHLRPPGALEPAWLHAEQQDISEVRDIVAQSAGPDVMLASDALRTTHVLAIERYPHRDDEGRLIQGREMSGPMVFELLHQNDRCFLHLRGTGRYWRLEDTACVPAA